MFTQENGMEIQEGRTYKSHVGDIVKVLKINKGTGQMKCYNVSESCTSWHRIDSAIIDNKFKAEIQ